MSWNCQILNCRFLCLGYGSFLLLQHEFKLKNQRKMDRTLLLLMMLFSLQMYAGTASMDEQEKKPVNIELYKGTSSDKDTHPRTLIPITCVYTDGMVQLSLFGEIGEFTLTVTNQMTGECWSAENTLVLQTSTANGIYWVQIVTEDGSVYCGTYTL